MMRLSRKYIAGSEEFKPLEETFQYPERIVQIGEGRFMRGFVDWLIHRLNVQGAFRGRIVVVAPRPSGAKHVQELNEQDGLFTVWLRGIHQGKRNDESEIITSVSRAVDPYENWADFLRLAENPDIDVCFSNTTESGIAYVPESYTSGTPVYSFPGKLTAYLYHRYQHFHGDNRAGMTIIPCELVENNGGLLRKIVLQYAKDWSLPESFVTWVNEANRFCDTLVDRIVTGYPSSFSPAELEGSFGYSDRLLTVGEPFHLFVIQGDDGSLEKQMPFAELGYNVKFVRDATPYRLQKVRVLNGAHTAMAYLGLFTGHQLVRDVVQDANLGLFIQNLLAEEIIPATLHESSELNRDDLMNFAQSVLERFENPFVDHKLEDLTLNGLSKFKTRLLPVFENFTAVTGQLPRRLALSLGALLLFYEPAALDGLAGPIRELKDDPESVALVQAVWAKEPQIELRATVKELLGLSHVWGTDLSDRDGLIDLVTECITTLRSVGSEAAVQEMLTKI